MIYHIYQDYTGNFSAAVKIRNGKTNDRYINAGELSGKIKCSWIGYTVNAKDRKEALRKYDEGEY